MFSWEYYQIFKTPILKIICERVLLKVKLNIFKLSKSFRTTCKTKNKPYLKKSFDFILLYLYNRFILVLKGLYERNCSTKGETHLFTSLLKMKSFLRNNILYYEVYRRRIDLMHNNLLVTVRLRLRSEAAVWKGSGKYVLLYDKQLMMRKAFKNSSRDLYILVRAQFIGLSW